MAKIAVSNTVSVSGALEELPRVGGYESLVREEKHGTKSLCVLVQGVKCAVCIQKIESTLSSQKDVREVHVNFGAQKLLIEWEGEKERANEFVQIVEELGYGVKPYSEKSAQSSVKSEGRFLLLCLAVAGFAMGNIMLLSIGVWSASGEEMGVSTRNFMHWISALIALPTILFSGRPFFRSALSVLRKGHTNMDVPISLAIILAGGISLFEMLHHGEYVYFDSAVMLIFFLLIGRYLDFKARNNARSSAHDLLQSFQGFASVVEGKNTKQIPIRDVKEGMMVRVSAGEKFPVDGVVYEGSGSVDTSLVTGETLPRTIEKQASVYAGTLNLSTPVLIKVVKAAEDSLLSDIVRLMDKAGQTRAVYVRIADKAAKLYTPVVHTMAALTFLGWLFLGGMLWQDSLLIAVTVLIITCPCALGLAVPVVQVLATGLLMKKGVLVKSGDALERLAAIDTIMFDKTGTLTGGDLKLRGAYDPDSLKMAASLAAHSKHPLSKAISRSYDGALLSCTDVQEFEGKGLQGESSGHKIQLGSRDWCGEDKKTDSHHIELWLSIDGQNKTCFTFEDRLRCDAKDVIASFKQAGIDMLLVSGDRSEVAEKIAKEAGIDEVYAQQNPKQKFEVLEKLQSEGKTVLMVGDGLNDAPVLSGANVSIAPGTAIDMAQNAADIVFMGGELLPVYKTYRIASMTQSLVKQNFVLAVSYNVIAIPLAVMGYVTPFLAALAMSGSSLLVIANSFRLKLRS
ncbi:MAG: cadmium-translocating P-type ATPase [Alphaproteobacteria bacterium]|nr:cadmium-translocating P-type ATPase [Alphaproteobacteria bacterium]